MRRQIELVQATADEIPLHVTPDRDLHLCPCPAHLFQRHLTALADYTVALNCVHALMAEFDGGEPGRDHDQGGT